MSACAVVTQENAAERLTRRVIDLLERERQKPRTLRRTATRLADALGIERSTLSQTLSGRHNSAFRLIHLDKIAEFFGVPPSTLIQYDHSSMTELTPAETRILRHWRTWPPDIQESLLPVYDYFAGLLPEEKEQRRWWQKINRIKRQSDRDYVERTVDDVIRAQRNERGGDTARVAQASSGQTAPATRSPRGRRA